MEFPALKGDDIEWLQDEFVTAVLKRIQENKEDRFTAKEERGKVKGLGVLFKYRHLCLFCKIVGLRFVLARFS